MLNEVCIGENICNFREGSSGVDLKCAVESLLVTEQVSEPLCMRVNDSSKSVDAQDLSRADVQEGSFGSGDAEELSTADPREESSTTDMKPVVEGILVTQQLSEPSCTDNDDFSKHLDARHLGGADIQEGLPAIDSKPTVEGIPVTQQLSDPSCIENDNLSKSEDTHHLARADFREGSSPIDIRPTVERISVTQPISDPSCTGDDDFSKSDDNAIHLSGANFWERSSVVKKLSITQHFSDPSCVENDDITKTDDAQGLSGGDSGEGSPIIGIKDTVAKSSVSEQLLDPSCTENEDMSKTVDAEDLSGADLKGGSSPRNLNSTAEISSVNRQFSEPSCFRNHDVSKGVDAQDLSISDFAEQLSVTNLDSTIEILSVSKHMSEPPCIGDNDFSKSIVAHSGGDDIVTPYESIDVGGLFGQNGNGGKCIIMVDGALEANLPDSICVPPRKRSLRNNRSRQNAQAEKPARNGRNLTNKKVSLNSDSFQITKKRRSCTSKRARSSVWGLLMDVQVSEQNGGVDINLSEHKKSARVRGGQARGKRVKNQSQTCLKKSKRKSCGITGCVSLKVKIGVALGPSSTVDAFSSDNNIERTTETFPVLSKEDELPRADGFQGCKENLDGTITCSDDSNSEFHLSGKNIANKTFDDLQQFPFGTEVDRMGASNDSRGLDSGTSPDSEVINLNPDTPYAGKGIEDLHDILSPSKACVPSEDVSSLSPMQKSTRKGKKKKMPQAGDCSPKGELLNSEIMDNGHQVTEIEQGEKAGDVSYSTEASASLTTANVSGNTSSTEGMSKEPLSSRVADVGKSCETGKPDNGREINLSSSICNEVESSVSQMLNKALSRSKGRKTSKSSKVEGMRNKKSEVSASAGENTSRKKMTRDKSISKLKLKGKLNGGLTSCEGEGQVQTDERLSDKGDSGTGNSILTGDMSTLEIEPRGVMEQNPKPRNAWVQCDDCHKWRRIPAILADQIEETKCRWTCKDNTDKDFADCSVPQEKSNAEINAELDISDASCDEGDACAAQQDSNQSRKNQSAVAQHSKWRLIKSNLFLHRNRKTQTIDEIMVCHCKPPPDGRMGCGDGCLNRMLNIECVQGTCPSGELCSNQQFQKRKYAKLKCVKCGKKGHGLQVFQDIYEGQFLIEYVGEVLDMQTYEARQREYALNGHKHFYFMTLNGSEVIDACAKGNLGRFINHSCDPNCRTEKWMVNGEVCIGLFALRNIKKGEELTFDYNYVRVFGAAAKKCVCGSSQCRGYIGGDPQNAEVIVQDDSEDEYPEPVMICEDDLSGETLNDKVTARRSFDCLESRTAKELAQDMDKLNKSRHIVEDLDVATEVQSATTKVAKKVEIDNSATVVGYVGVTEESGDSLNKITSAALEAYVSVEMEESVGQLQSLAQRGTALKLDGSTSENVSIGEHDCSAAERNMKRSSCSTAGLEENSPSALGKISPDAMEIKRKLKSGIGKSRIKSSKHFMKNSRSSSSVKKEKPKSSVTDKKLEQMHGKFDRLSCKSKKIVEGSSTFRFEAVQEKLNELLDHDGGISKRKDSSRGYLKLLLLTAASGDSGDGETIQSNRDLSMILDALLKTKSRTVLVDIINKNGLQMLHNMLKRYRKEFKKIPILRKLLKVFEYLATREILTSEQINGGPPCPGVESFRESILSFTEHTDKQVHQIARSFRDRWIPRSSRKNSCMDWEGSKSEFHRGLDYSKFSVQNRLSDRSRRHSETPDPISESIVTSSTVDAGTTDNSRPSCSTGTRTRKRKSRWDQPADSDPRVENNMACDGNHNIDDDVPPGFAAPLNASVVPSEASLHAHCIQPNLSYGMRLGREVSLGHPQQRFVSRLSVSYGVPLLTVQQMGTPHQGRLDGWSVAPGMPFNSFPPLPLYPRDKRDPLSHAADSSMMGQPAQVGEQDHNRSANHHSGVNPPSSSRESLQDVEMSAGNNKLNFQQSRGSNTLGRKYFRQQKWNSSKLGPPWIRNRNNWAFTGNNSRNGMYDVGPGPNEFRNPHTLEQVNGDMDSYAYHHHQPPQY